MSGQATHKLVVHASDNRLHSTAKHLVQPYVLRRHLGRGGGRGRPFQCLAEGPSGCYMFAEEVCIERVLCYVVELVVLSKRRRRVQQGK